MPLAYKPTIGSKLKFHYNQENEDIERTRYVKVLSIRDLKQIPLSEETIRKNKIKRSQFLVLCKDLETGNLRSFYDDCAEDVQSVKFTEAIKVDVKRTTLKLSSFVKNLFKR